MNRLLLPLAVTIPFWPSAAEESPAVVFRETMLRGLHARGLNLKDTRAVFAAVFAQLPAEVSVQPTENYYYWQLFCDGREVRGNIRLPSGQREKGTLCLGYAEFDEFPNDGGPEPELSEWKYFGRADGVDVTCPDKFSSVVTFAGKAVTFRFLQLPQVPPKRFPLPPDEQFIERTFDESGIQFFLLYNTRNKYFLWVLNDEAEVPDHFYPLEPDIVIGRRTGFAFWIDRANGNRKVLAAVRHASVERNDCCDGPFDQLADNYADETNIRHFIVEAIPACRDRIDKWGYFTDQGENPQRVALNAYGTWTKAAEIADFARRGKATGDFLQFISRAGIEAPPPPRLPPDIPKNLK
jgi:hypothetical protein